MPGTVTAPVLRSLMDQVLLNDSALEAFVVDHFPQVKRLYGSGMDRTAKVTLLLEHISCEQIYSNLCQNHPQAATHRTTSGQPNTNKIANAQASSVANQVETHVRVRSGTPARASSRRGGAAVVRPAG